MIQLRKYGVALGFSVEVPQKADADGLIACLGDAFGVSNILCRESILGVAADGKPVLVGGGTDQLTYQVKMG